MTKSRRTDREDGSRPPSDDDSEELDDKPTEGNRAAAEASSS